MIAYLSLKQNKTTQEIEDIDRYTPTSNLSFFTVLQPAVEWVVWQLAHAYPASNLLILPRKKERFFLYSFRLSKTK